jgi:hypothetical protein
MVNDLSCTCDIDGRKKSHPQASSSYNEITSTTSIFHSYEDILYPCMIHTILGIQCVIDSFFPCRMHAPQLPSPSQFTIKDTCSIPVSHFDWIKHPITTPDAFKEENMANISPTIKLDISVTLRVIDNILLGAAYHPKEIFQ